MIISVALTGTIPSRAKCPTLPVEPLKTAEHALLGAELCDCVVHLRTRDKHGDVPQDPEKLLTAVGAIRGKKRRP